MADIVLSGLAGAPNETALLNALRRLPPHALGLDNATKQGGMVPAESVSLSMLAMYRSRTSVTARISAFFDERVGGCNCHDDPVEVACWCSLTVELDWRSGMGTVQIDNS